MERKEAMLKIGCLRILWAVTAILLLVTPCIAGLIDVDGTNSPYVLDTEVAHYLRVAGTDPTFPYGPGTLQIMPGGYASLGVYVNLGGTIEIYGSHQWNQSDAYVNVAPSANVKLLTDDISSIILESTYPPDATIVGATITVDDTLGWTGKLTWDYDSVTYSLNISTFSDITVEIVGSEDPAELILQLIDTVEALNLHQGIDNSLDAKLDAALNALDDINENNDAAAINTIQAFINAVEAQRDNKITSEQADTLIAVAQAIIVLLSS